MDTLAKKFSYYADRFREAMDARHLTNEAVAERMDAHSVTVSKLRSGKIKLDDEWRERVAGALDMAPDVLFSDAPLPAPRPEEMHIRKRVKRRDAANDNRMIGLFGLAAGSMQGAQAMTNSPIEQIPCPPGLADVIGAYALQTSGESMIPRYFPRDVLYVHPTQPIQRGDHVVIQVQRYEGAPIETWVKRYDGARRDMIVLSQYNPPAVMEFRKDFVLHMHRVLPVNELFGLQV